MQYTFAPNTPHATSLHMHRYANFRLVKRFVSPSPCELAKLIKHGGNLTVSLQRGTTHASFKARVGLYRTTQVKNFLSPKLVSSTTLRRLYIKFI